MHSAARKTSYYTGSDLRELCKIACQRPINEIFERHNFESNEGNSDLLDNDVRPINTNDFLEAMKEVPASLNQYANYQNYQRAEDRASY